jgi:hypothetical protein
MRVVSPKRGCLGDFRGNQALFLAYRTCRLEFSLEFRGRGGGRLRTGSRGDGASELSQGEGLFFHCFGSRFQDSPNMVKFPQPCKFPLDRLMVLCIESELPTPRRSKNSQFSRTRSDEVGKISHADPKRKGPLGILVTPYLR